MILYNQVKRTQPRTAGRRRGKIDMTKQEFETLARIEVSYETYSKVIEPMYMAVDITKEEFVKILNTKVLSEQKEKAKTIKKMRVRDKSGYEKTPNGCWYHIEYVELVDVDIRTGKFIIRPLVDEDFQKLLKDGCDLNLSTVFDFDYTQCIDTKKNPIVLRNE